jgi:large subunit ribosomal protein L22
MQAKAIARQIRMSPRKVRLVVDQVRGLPVNEAYAILEFSKKSASEPV